MKTADPTRLIRGKSAIRAEVPGRMAGPPRFTDLSGRAFGRLIVVDLAGLDANGHYRWQAVCECGGFTTACGHDLVRGHTRSCGCLKREAAAALRTGKGVAITPGARFGRLTVLEPSGRDGSNRQLVRLRCECGQEHVARWLNVHSGGTKSCGRKKYEPTRRTPPRAAHPWRASA